MKHPFPEGQLSKEQALAIYESPQTYEAWSSEQIVALQLFQERLCVPFSCFHKAIEDVLGRPVFTHEFAYRDHLVDEYYGMKPTSTMEDVIALIPAEKLIVVEVSS